MSGGRVVVVGAGIGGLAVSLDLASAGVPVTVLEAGLAPGGKVREAVVGGARFDEGPALLTMRWVFDELFERSGRSLESTLELVRVELLARHAWTDGSRLDLHADAARCADAIGAFAGADAKRGFDEFRARARAVYRTLEGSFIKAQRPTPMGLVAGAGGALELLRVKPFETLWRELGHYFSDLRLRQLFGRYATYCGSSPFQAPATLVLIPHVELEGVWAVKGGMQRLASALADRATALGATFRYGARVVDVLVDRGEVSGVELAGGERLAAQAVVANADAASIGAGHLGRAAAAAVGALPAGQRSLSAITWALVGQASGFPLERQNLFFAEDAAGEYADVFERRRVPRSPTVYVGAQDRGAGGLPQDGKPERLFCIIHAPATGDEASPSQREIEECGRRMFGQLERCGLRVTPAEEGCRVTGPVEFERRFPGTGGALHGRVTHGAMATFQRPGARTRLPGLYLAGASAHPGAGLPMAALSGRLAAQSLLSDLPSTARSRPAGTPGGTSTR